MKKLLLYTLTLLTSSVFAQNHRIDSNFEVDKTYQLTVKRARMDSKDPMTQDMAQLTAIEATFSPQDEKLKCVWKYGETKPVGPEELIAQIGPEYYELFNIYQGIEIELLFDPIKGGIELLNHEQMKENLRNASMKMYKNQATKIDPATMASMIDQQLAPTYSTPEVLLSSYFPEVVLYFNLYGQTIPEGSLVKGTYTHPHPFGGRPFPVAVETTAETKDENTLLITSKEQSNRGGGNGTYTEEMPIGRNPNEIPSLRLTGQSTYLYDQTLQLIRELSFEKVIKARGVSQTEMLEIRLIE